VIVKEAEAQEEEALWKKREEEAKQRKKESRNLVGESIRRELAESEYASHQELSSTDRLR
jgi:microfibrillar-associated protein 1